MTEFASINHEDFMPGNQQALDANLLVKFYLRSMRDKSRSEAEGRPVFKDVEFIDVRIPGSRDNIARPATPQDKERFPNHYARFKARQEMPTEGTPLSEWPGVTRAQVEELAFLNIKTVEALASVADNTQGIRGLQTYKRKAQDWLTAAKENAPAAKLAEELALRDAQLAAQAKTIEALTERLDALQGEAPMESPALDSAEPEPEPEPEAKAEPAPEPAPRAVRRRRVAS